MSAEFAPGVRVEARGEDFLIRKVKTYQGREGSQQLLEAEGLSELVRGQRIWLDTALEDDLKVLDPKETVLRPDQETGYRRLKLYLETQIRNAPALRPRIAIAHKAAFHRSAFQYEPALKALGHPRARILIADGVGLGKTVETGILLAELQRRGQGQRVLVIALKSILAQFQQEIWNRFAIPLKRLDSVGIARIKTELPANKNPFDYYDKTIVSIDTLKNNQLYRRYIERTRWDVIVIDECHTVANVNSQRGDLAQFLATRCDHLILTSATPHNGRKESFANLIRMIEPVAIARSGDYGKEDVEPYYVRRFKQHIEDEDMRAQFQEREIVRHTANLHPVEEELLATSQASRFAAMSGDSDRQDHLFAIQLFKSFLSSPAAMLASVRNRIAVLDERLAQGKPKRGLQDDRDFLHGLIAPLERILNERLDSKYAALTHLLDGMKWKGRKRDERIVIFAERIDTISYLIERLTEDYDLKEDAVARFDGSLGDTEQQQVIEDFGKEDSKVRLFVTSDAGSQGVNLHYYCHRMVNYDIPWSLITLEQRNGRIDRFGQNNTPYIHYLVSESAVKGTKTDLHIIGKLVEKEEEVHRTLGDAASVMKLYDAQQEEQQVEKALLQGSPAPIEGGFDLDGLFGDEGDTTEALTVEDPIDEQVSLYADEAQYYRELLHQLESDGQLPAGVVRDKLDDGVIEVFHHAEFKRLLRGMPPEAIPAKDQPFRLTLDAEMVETAIARARKKEGAWADAQILYDLHPLARYFMTKLEARVDRNEALIAEVMTLPYDSAWFVFHGQVANGLGHPVVSEFFVVPLSYSGGNMIERPMSIDAFIEQYGLQNDLRNLDIDAEEVGTLQSLLPDAIDYAQEFHMKEAQARRAREFETEITDYEQRLKDWEAAARHQMRLDFPEEENARGFQKYRWEQAAQHIASVVEREEKFYDQLLALDQDAHLRVLAVLFNHEAPRS